MHGLAVYRYILAASRFSWDVEAEPPFAPRYRHKSNATSGFLLARDPGSWVSSLSSYRGAWCKLLRRPWPGTHSSHTDSCSHLLVFLHAPQEMEPSPSHQLAAPIARMLVVDDLLGKVYASCSSPSDRRAFRHATAACYRSPSINAQIFAYVNPPGGLDIDITAALAAFPRHAQLKALFLRNPAPSFKELFKRLLLCNDE
eukprot:1146345-Pelagomonas_calceolata.AAC.1